MSQFSALFPGLFNEGVEVARCLECGSDFTRKSRSKWLVCSKACKRLRGLRYGVEYRQNNRELRAKIYAMFGGRAPTGAELLKHIKSKKENP